MFKILFSFSLAFDTLRSRLDQFKSFRKLFGLFAILEADNRKKSVNEL